MQAMRVVPRFNPAKNIQLGLRFGRLTSALNELALQRGKEALCDGVVIRISYRAHGGAFHLLAALANGHAGALAAYIAVVDDLAWASGVQRHVQRRNHKVRRHPCAKGSSHYLAAASANGNCQIQKALPSRDIDTVLNVK